MRKQLMHMVRRTRDGVDNAVIWASDTLFTARRKGIGLKELPAVGLAFVLIAVVFGIGGLILSEMSNKVNNNNTTEIMNIGTSAIKDLAGWLPIIGVVVAAVVIIALIIRGFSRGDLS